ncbi:transglycosylase SLT domain-containing protein [Quatrionicoccus australiensis]|uniref:transglycosylase SLT domain-containing protein n=1 Tax=Quatrionicoccus australiensis TaxID=138118 RepID=UPI001CF9EFEF|nr:transglycosylase SLT domain-containing protein [Quatrionicoccus australiensis]
MAPAHAETATEKASEKASDAGGSFRLISLLMPSLLSDTPPEPSLRIEDNALATYELRSAPQLPGTIDLTANPDNLWDRIRNGFSMIDLNDDLTLYYQQWYQNRPDALRRMVERSRPYMHYIVQELEARGMPTELALLPMVESSFNPMAYSRSNASGLWQFIPATGKRFNLEQNWWQDQRRDIVASTGAALDYLQTIYEMHGDWHLALASYNWGEGAVKRAIEKNNARGLPTDYANLNMPNETRHYVPKLQALKNIFGNPVLMVQLRLPEILNRPYFATIDTGRTMDVKTAARLANMPLEEFIALNPSHNRPVIKADTPLVIPTDKLETFRSNLERHSAPLTEWQAYTLKHGEKLNQVGSRFGIATPELLRINGLPTRARLGAGTTLLVPAGRGADDIGRLAATPSLPQIFEPEPESRSSSKGGKSAKGGKNKAEGKQASKGGKTDSRQAAGKRDSKQASSKPAGKTAKAGGDSKSASKSAKSGSDSKSASKGSGKAPKVAKSGNGKRG